MQQDQNEKTTHNNQQNTQLTQSKNFVDEYEYMNDRVTTQEQECNKKQRKIED